MRKKEWILLILCIISIGISSTVSFGEECAYIRENTLRLHILANSDSPNDQKLKERVRDAILESTGDLFSACQTRQQVLTAAQSQLESIRETAHETVLLHGYDIPVEVALVDMYFETRRYDDVLLPAGTYTAVRILLGEGAGQNWWCVLYPPLCTGAAQGDFSPEQAAVESHLLRQDQLPRYRARLALVEWWETLVYRWRQL